MNQTVENRKIAMPSFIMKPIISEKLASSDDPIPDTCGLRNTFPESGWTPKTVDDYTSAYINKISNPVVVAKDIIDKVKLVNSEMKIFCDWDENQIMQDAKECLKHILSRFFRTLPVVFKLIPRKVSIVIQLERFWVHLMAYQLL